MSARMPLPSVKELGSTKEGSEHWWLQRITSVVLIPLVLWLAFSIAMLDQSGYTDIVAWLRSPISATAVILFLIAAFLHLKLGIQVIIEDYVHLEWLKLTLLILNIFGCLIFAVGGIGAVLKIFL